VTYRNKKPNPHKIASNVNILGRNYLDWGQWRFTRL